MPPQSQSDCKLSPRACELPTCGTTESNLLRCSAGKAVYYCRASRLSAADSSGTLTASYQAADRERHTKGCNALKNTRMAYAKEDKTLRKYRDPIWELHEPLRDWDIMLEVFGGPGGHVDSVKEALYHLLEMLRLSRSDNTGLRDTVPGLYIRLNMDQAAYDFMKWYATTDKCYWNIDTTPYLDVKNADILEDPLDIWIVWPGPSISLAHVAAVLLIKVRILLGLQAAQNATRAFKGTIPAEIIEIIRSHLVGRIVASSRPDILLGSPEKLADLIQRVKKQVRLLYESINRYNPHFSYLIQDEPYPEAEGALVALGHALKRDNLASWAETPGAFEIIRALGAEF
ncbi:mynd finger [Fusarium flagelliforme]|uniref:Mynd finger n=1 Tax=Fusarium flagelliforme TaxID=2675880 RepID=A0A395MZA5_9HYPO|nr:mynd finger [Fusarium flagelliforme]